MADDERHALLLLELAEIRDDLDEQLGDRDLSVAVERELLTPNRSVRPVFWTRPRRAIAIAVAAVATILVVPPARAAVFNLFRIGAIIVEAPDDDAPPKAIVTPSTTSGLQPFVGLGREVTIEQARAALPLVVPDLPESSRPDQVRLDTTNAPHASLLYRARPGLAEIPNSDGAGLLIEEFQADGRLMMGKYLSQQTETERFDINGEPAAYLSGDRHMAWYVDALGNERMETERTVGNALIFQRGDLTIRIEGDLSKDRMIEIARSLR